MLPGTGSVRLLLALLLGVTGLGLGLAMLLAGRSTASLQRLAGPYTPGRSLQHTGSPAAAQVMRQHEERHIVVAAYREDLSWLQQLPHIPHTIYTSHNASAEHPMWIEQAEAGAYLQFILERYENLPDATAFIQAHQTAEHMPDKVPLLKRLRWRRWPYANLRYQGITSHKWGNWTGDWLNLRNPEEAPPAHEVVWDKLRIEQSRLYAEVWQTLMASEFGPLPRFVHAPCCAEMLVSKQRILAHPKAFYQTVFDWLSTRTEEIWESNRWASCWLLHLHVQLPRCTFMCRCPAAVCDVLQPCCCLPCAAASSHVLPPSAACSVLQPVHIMPAGSSVRLPGASVWLQICNHPRVHVAHSVWRRPRLLCSY